MLISRLCDPEMIWYTACRLFLAELACTAKERRSPIFPCVLEGTIQAYGPSADNVQSPPEVTIVDQDWA